MKNILLSLLFTVAMTSVKAQCEDIHIIVDSDILLTISTPDDMQVGNDIVMSPIRIEKSMYRDGKTLHKNVLFLYIFEHAPNKYGVQKMPVTVTFTDGTTWATQAVIFNELYGGVGVHLTLTDTQLKLFATKTIASYKLNTSTFTVAQELAEKQKAFADCMYNAALTP